jgi:hypothetical protein
LKFYIAIPIPVHGSSGAGRKYCGSKSEFRQIGLSIDSKRTRMPKK